MQTEFGATVKCPCCGEKVDATVTATLSGRYRADTRLDPGETPEVDELTVIIDATEEDITDRLGSLDRERLEETAMERASEDDAEAKEDAAERRAEAIRDARRMGDY